MISSTRGVFSGQLTNKINSDENYQKPLAASSHSNVWQKVCKVAYICFSIMAFSMPAAMAASDCVQRCTMGHMYEGGSGSHGSILGQRDYMHCYMDCGRK